MERKGKFVLSPPPAGQGWWSINDMEKMYAVASVQSTVPGAEEIIRFAWGKVG